MAPPSPGLDISRVSPQDAIATLRSLRRRFAEAFDQADSPEVVSARPPGGGLSPLEHAAWTAIAVAEIGAALRRVMATTNPPIELPAAGPPGPVLSDQDDPTVVLSRLGDTARSVADEMAEVHGNDWTRVGQTAAGQVSGLDIARRAVQVSVEHLRTAQQAILGRPS